MVETNYGTNDSDEQKALVAKFSVGSWWRLYYRDKYTTHNKRKKRKYYPNKNLMLARIDYVTKRFVRTGEPSIYFVWFTLYKNGERISHELEPIELVDNMLYPLSQEDECAVAVVILGDNL